MGLLASLIFGSKKQLHEYVVEIYDKSTSYNKFITFFSSLPENKIKTNMFEEHGAFVISIKRKGLFFTKTIYKDKTGKYGWADFEPSDFHVPRRRPLLITD